MFTGSHASFGGKWWKVWNVWMPTLRVTGYRHGRLRAGTQKWRWKRIFLFNWVIFSWRVIFSFQRLVLRGVWIGLNRCCWNGAKKKSQKFALCCISRIDFWRFFLWYSSRTGPWERGTWKVLFYMRNSQVNHLVRCRWGHYQETIDIQIHLGIWRRLRYCI